MRRRNCLGLFRAAVFALLGAAAAVAGEANYQQYQIGGRSAGMGGAVCATVDSLESAMYNPAGLARGTGDSVSVSGSLYGWQRLEVSDALFINESFESRMYENIPTLAGGTARLGEDWVGGFSAIVLEQHSGSLQLVQAEGRHAYTFSDSSQSMLVGPSLGYRANERLTLGASLFVAYIMSTASRSLYWGDHGISHSSYFRLRTFEVLGVLGAQLQLADHWFAGLSLATPSATVAGNGTYQQQTSLNRLDDQGQTFEYADDLDSSYNLPAKMTAGLGYRQPGRYGAGLDVSYHMPGSSTILSGTLNDGQEVEAVFHRNWVLDANLGGELYLGRNYPVRAGFFTSQSAMREEDLGRYSTPSIDLYGVTASVGRESRNILLDLGVNYTFGSGKDYGWTVLDPVVPQRVVNAREENLYIFLNTSYMF